MHEYKKKVREATKLILENMTAEKDIVMDSKLITAASLLREYNGSTKLTYQSQDYLLTWHYDYIKQKIHWNIHIDPNKRIERVEIDPDDE